MAGPTAAGDLATPISATAMMTPTTPLSTREARILAGREVLLRSSPESYRRAHRSASIMSTSSTASSLNMADRTTTTTAQGDPSSIPGGGGDASPMVGGGGVAAAAGKGTGTATGSMARQGSNMSAMQYWKLVQDQEQQNLRDAPGLGGAMGAIPGRGRMVELWSQITSGSQDSGEGASHEGGKEADVHPEGVIKVLPEQLVFPDQSIRPIPLKAFRVRKMTLMERSQEYAQACHEFSKARTGLDVWILRSMMQDCPEVMKNPPPCVLQAQKANESATSGARRASKDVSHFYLNNNNSWNTSSTISLNSPMSASTPTSAVGGGGGSSVGNGGGYGFGSVSSSTTGSFVGGARAKIKNAGKRLSMEISHPFATSGPTNSVPSMMEDGRRSSMSTHSQNSVRSSTTSDRYKNGGVESPFYKQKITKSAVELGSWSSQRSRAFSEHHSQQQQQQNQNQNQDQLHSQQQQQSGLHGSMGPSGQLSSSFGSQRDSFHQYYQQHQRQQQQGLLHSSVQRSSTIGPSSSINGSNQSITASVAAAATTAATTAAGASNSRQRHSFSGARPQGPGSLRSRTAVDVHESSTIVGRRNSAADVGAGSTGDGPGNAGPPPFGSMSGRRRSIMGPSAEPTDRYGGANSGSLQGHRSLRSAPLASSNGAGMSTTLGGGVPGSGHKHEMSSSTSASSLSSTSSSSTPSTTTTTTAATITGSAPAAVNGSGSDSSNNSSGGSGMGPSRPNPLQPASSFSARRRPMSMMVNTTLTSLAEHQALTTSTEASQSSSSASGLPSSYITATSTASTSTPSSTSSYATATSHGFLSIPLADETTSKEIYSPLTSPIIIPEGGFNIPAGSTLALRAVAMNSPPTPREGGIASGGMARPLTFAGYGPGGMNVSSLALGPPSLSSASLASFSLNEVTSSGGVQGGGGGGGGSLSPKSSKKKKESSSGGSSGGGGGGHDSLSFKKSFRRDLSFRRLARPSQSSNKNEPNSPASTSSSVSTATGAAMRPMSSVSGGGGSGGSGMGGGGGGVAAAADLQGSTIMTMNMSEALWEQSLDNLSDVLPHIDRDRLLIYLQRAGGDEMIAIGLAMSDLRSGDLY
ncbi:hypothetical protein DFQ26_007373 [Actinomortierella ambigua]|nr:hypothetical protein DFQ26_007373 [Actinomortierella ambigua]